jgi:hypothetical protein
MEVARDILEEYGIPEDRADELLEEMDGLILFVPRHYKLVSEVKR